VNQSRGEDGQTRIQFSKESLNSPHSVFDQPETKYDSAVLTQSLKTKDALQGININYFVRNCDFLSLSLPHINKRILVAIGLDIQNSHALVTWQHFLDLFCIFESGQVEREELIRFWIKFFDQKLIGHVPEEDYMKLLEEIVRGNRLRKGDKTTQMFALMFQKMMQ